MYLYDVQEVEPSIGERLCRLWEKVESDEDVLCGRSGSSRDHQKSHAGSGVPSGGGHASFSSRHGQHNMPSYPTPAMYFPYTMPPSMFTSTGGGDARNRIGLPSHPYFTHLPRLGYSAANPHLPPPSLHHTDGGGGGHFPRLGRPWWTVPPFPPPSHLHHPHNHPPPNDSRPFSIEVQHPSTTTQQTPVTSITSEAVPATTTSSVPRTTSRNAYTQQRLSILKKQQQKEQASKKNLYFNSALKQAIPDVAPKVKMIAKNPDLDIATHKEIKEEKGVQQMDAKFSSKFMPSQ